MLYWVILLSMAIRGGGYPPVDINIYHGDGMVVIGVGAASGANDGVLEGVARNRMRGLAEPSLPLDTNLARYVAIATESCDYVGRTGWMILTDGVAVARLPVLVVDCQDEADKVGGGSLTDLGLLADVSARAKRYWHWRGYLLLED